MYNWLSCISSCPLKCLFCDDLALTLSKISFKTRAWYWFIIGQGFSVWSPIKISSLHFQISRQCLHPSCFGSSHKMPSQLISKACSKFFCMCLLLRGIWSPSSRALRHAALLAKVMKIHRDWEDVNHINLGGFLQNPAWPQASYFVSGETG